MINAEMERKIIAILGIINVLISIVISKKMQIDFTSLMLIGIILITFTYILLKNDNILLTCILISSLTLTFLIENIGVNSKIKYILDYFILIALFKNIFYYARDKVKITKIHILMIIFILFSIISAIINKTYVKRYIFALYADYARYFIIFISVCNLKLKENYLFKCCRNLGILLVLQIPIVITQYFYYKYTWIPRQYELSQDYISGILGGKATSELGMYICIFMAIMFILYQREKITLSRFSLLIIGMFVMLILSESKFAIFLMIGILVVLAMIKTNFKGVISILVTVIVCYISITQIAKIYPYFDDFFFNSNSLKEYTEASNYAGSNLGRSTSFIVANEQIQENGAIFLFGRGIGNSKTSEVKPEEKNEFILNNIYNFRMFTISQYIVENGWLGFITFISIWIYLFYMSIILIIKGKTQEQQIIGNFGIALIIIIIASIFYLMCMMKISFSVVAWFLMALIYKAYENYKVKLEVQ